jgi:hypothetical protein
MKRLNLWRLTLEKILKAVNPVEDSVCARDYHEEYN